MQTPKVTAVDAPLGEFLAKAGMALPDLYLMRHGETRWNAEGRLQGQLDSPLTQRGLRQARWQAELVADVRAKRLASPQGRAVATAQIVFGNRGFQTLTALAEIGLGRFAGQRLDLLQRDHSGVFAAEGLGWYDRVPGGEGFVALAARCCELLAALEGPALIVGHGITLRMIWALAMGRCVTQLDEAPLEQGRVLVLRNGRSEVWRHQDDQKDDQI